MISCRITTASHWQHHAYCHPHPVIQLHRNILEFQCLSLLFPYSASLRSFPCPVTNNSINRKLKCSLCNTTRWSCRVTGGAGQSEGEGRDPATTAEGGHNPHHRSRPPRTLTRPPTPSLTPATASRPLLCICPTPIPLHLSHALTNTPPSHPYHCNTCLMNDVAFTTNLLNEWHRTSRRVKLISKY